MALISLKHNKKDNNGSVVRDRIEEDPNGKGLVTRSSKREVTLSNRNGLINGLTIAEQDPALNRGSRSAKDKKKKVGASAALLKK